MSKHRIELEKAYDKKVDGFLNKVIRRVALSVDAQLKQQTPVDTGRAAGNWIPSLDVPSSQKLQVGQTVNLAPVLGRFRNDSTIYFTNNLPYIVRLNEGYSQQAPSGYVDDIVDSHQRVAQQEARSIGRGL